jgi:hypothetical protein
MTARKSMGRRIAPCQMASPRYKRVTAPIQTMGTKAISKTRALGTVDWGVQSMDCPQERRPRAKAQLVPPAALASRKAPAVMSLACAQLLPAATAKRSASRRGRRYAGRSFASHRFSATQRPAACRPRVATLPPLMGVRMTAASFTARPVLAMANPVDRDVPVLPRRRTAPAFARKPRTQAIPTPPSALPLRVEPSSANRRVSAPTQPREHAIALRVSMAARRASRALRAPTAEADRLIACIRSAAGAVPNPPVCRSIRRQAPVSPSRCAVATGQASPIRFAISRALISQSLTWAIARLARTSRDVPGLSARAVDAWRNRVGQRLTCKSSIT